MRAALTTPAARQYWSKAAYNLALHYGNAEHLDDARAIYDDISTLARNHHDQPELRVNQAKAAYNLAHDYGNADKLDDARAIYDDISTIARNHDDEPPLAQCWACALGVLCHFLRAAGQGDVAKHLLAGVAAERGDIADASQLFVTRVSDPGKADELLAEMSEGDPQRRAWLAFLSTPGATLEEDA